MTFPQQILAFLEFAEIWNTQTPFFAASCLQQSQIAAGMKLQKEGLGVSRQTILGKTAILLHSVTIQKYKFTKLIFFISFFSMTFSWLLLIFQANLKFNDFSSQELNLMTFQGAYEPHLFPVVFIYQLLKGHSHGKKLLV